MKILRRSREWINSKLVSAGPSSSPEVEAGESEVPAEVAPEFLKLIDEIVGSYSNQMRLTPDGKLAGFYNPPVKPVASRVAEKLVKAGEIQPFDKMSRGSVYQKIESTIMDLPQRRAQELGLQNSVPPPHVHFMRKEKGVFFDLRNADIVAAALAKANMEFSPKAHYLDFGCSSGRTVRTLDLAYPQSFWHGVDPVEDSINFARMAIPAAAFRVSPQSPPLPYTDSVFDGAFGLSIWSHFSAEAGIEWLREMRRVVKPGGFVLFTVHGFTDVATKASRALASSQTLRSIFSELSTNGFAFQNDIREGHRGLETSDWGTAFMTKQWIETNYLPLGWQLAWHEFGQWGNRQDVYVLKAI